ncbi:unnamed protein product [Paramecium sonneborni]|uniref:RING-type domain-containing protein n=1 Tax=Paramecium sonneborni TaxID=65129 RepID=A0A8S1M5E4_9CILI|nr:unnamed protein product [Paramecium sonneborni]
MIQVQYQVVTALLISESEEAVQRFLKRINTNKLQNEIKTINLFYKKINFNNELECLKQFSLFEYAILFLQDLEFQQFTMDNFNFRMLKLLQYFNYKQVFLVYDEIETQKNDTQIQNLYTWINQEVNSIFNNEQLNEQQEQNNFTIPLPEIKTQTQPMQNDFFNFFKNIENLENQDQILVVMENNNVNEGIAYIVNGFIINGQTILYQEQDALQKVQITNFVDYFSKKEINFAQKGDIIEFKFNLNKKIGGFLFGLCQDKYLLLNKEVTANLVCPVNVGQGGIHKFQKSDSKAFFFGIEMLLEKKKILGQLNGNKYDEMKQLTTKPFGMTFRFTKQQFYLTSHIIDKNLPFLVVKNKNFPVVTIFCAKILNKEIINITKQQVQKQKVVLIPKLTSPPSQNMVSNGVDFRQKCRVCKTENIRYVPTDCGHLRYCNECKDICIEAKQCLYCENICTSTQSFNIHLTKENLQEVKSINQKQILEYFTGNPDKKMLPILNIFNEINVEQNIQCEINCDNCDSVITSYSICKNNHLTLLCDLCQIPECKKCNEKLIFKQKIIYQFPDDPIN